MRETVTFNGRAFPVVGSRPRNDAAAPAIAAQPKRRKYGNRHCIIGSERFDSEREGRRHQVLLERQRKGEISDLKRQVTFKLYVNGQLIGSVRPDWTYLEGNKLVADDCKGFQTRDHKTRWKLAIALHPEIEWRLS